MKKTLAIILILALAIAGIGTAIVLNDKEEEVVFDEIIEEVNEEELVIEEIPEEEILEEEIFWKGKQKWKQYVNAEKICTFL